MCFSEKKKLKKINKVKIKIIDNLENFYGSKIANLLYMYRTVIFGDILILQLNISS